MKVIVLLVFLLAACGKAETKADTIGRLKFMRAGEVADLVRHEAECRATAIEFSGTDLATAMVGSCMGTHRFMVKTSGEIIAALDKRIAELEGGPIYVQDEFVRGEPNYFDRFDQKSPGP